MRATQIHHGLWCKIPGRGRNVDRSCRQFTHFRDHTRSGPTTYVIMLCLIASSLGQPFRFGEISSLQAAEQSDATKAESSPSPDVAATPTWTAPDDFLSIQEGSGPFDWPKLQPEHRPGAYWWWPASAVTKQDLTWNLETYRKAGWGNLGVIGIYGVRGEEDRFIDIFSPRWFEMYNHAVAEAERLEMNIDLTPSSGWRLGGPHVTPQYAEQSYAVEGTQIVARNRRDRVKRAGPGGEGLTVNPYSREAVAFHFDWLSQRFRAAEGRSPRAFYYDSFENPGNWCPEFLESFRQWRGYSLEDHAAALAGPADDGHTRRVLCDYRETLSDLLIARIEQIRDWANARGSSLRVQAHGAPANLLDMYATAEIPETEVFGASIFDIPGFRRDPQWIRPDRQSDLVNRFASSAAHVADRELIISESFTWLRNHYHTALSQIKAEADKLLLNGINGIYYHGICFAPEKTAWPGWLFYASTQANARNSIFRDISVLNAYISRCQSLLQAGRPHNDVLVYWPVYDLWMDVGNADRRFTVHDPDWIEKTDCGDAGRWMIDHGYTFDFVSDRQLRQIRCENQRLTTTKGNQYRAILVPAARHVPPETIRQLIDLARSGATVLVWKSLPRDVPGWQNHADRQQELAALLGEIQPDATGSASFESGRFIVGEDLSQLLDAAEIPREALVDCGLQFIRRQNASHVTYFLVNHTAHEVNGWIPFASPCRSAVLMDPMTGRAALASTRAVNGRTEIELQMRPGETRLLRVFAEELLNGPSWPSRKPVGIPSVIDGPWQISFVEGGPVLPQDVVTETLKSWTQIDTPDAERFAGAARYTATFRRPEQPADGWLLDLGDVRESARVWVNGHPAGVVVAHPFRVDVTDWIQDGDNHLAIEVTNLSANRIRDLDRRGIEWKKFYDINLVDHQYKPFDASNWELKPSGLLGPVTLQAVLHSSNTKE